MRFKSLISFCYCFVETILRQRGCIIFFSILQKFPCRERKMICIILQNFFLFLFNIVWIAFFFFYACALYFIIKYMSFVPSCEKVYFVTDLRQDNMWETMRMLFFFVIILVINNFFVALCFKCWMLLIRKARIVWASRIEITHFGRILFDIPS